MPLAIMCLNVFDEVVRMNKGLWLFMIKMKYGVQSNSRNTNAGIVFYTCSKYLARSQSVTALSKESHSV
jgi:hypothetical protein